MGRIKVYNIFLIIFVMLLFFYQDINAQISVVLQQPPPFQFKIENMWKVTLINPTTSTYTVYLKGEATESVKGQIVSATTAAFQLAPGAKIVNQNELVPLSVEVNNDKYANVIQNIGAVPTGDYEICVTVFNAQNGQQLGMQCIEAQAQNMSQVQLLQPENNTRFLSGTNAKNSSDEISGSKMVTGSFISFNWLPPSPVPAGVKTTYSLKITEIFGNQSAYDALLSNPAFYINQNIISNVFLYPVEGRSFRNNSRYAWKVSAYINNVLVSESETWEFTYMESKQKDLPITKSGTVIEQDNTSFIYFKEHLQLASTDDSQLLNMIYDTEKENQVKPVAFSGNAKISYDAGYKKLPFSEEPGHTITAELAPTLSIYGLPFTADLLVTSQQGGDRQSMNSASFNFDLNSYKEQLKARLGNKITETAVGWEKFLLGVDAFGIGTNYPVYTDYTLKGVPVTGINFEINPGIFYAAFAASNNQRAVDNSAFKRYLYAGRLGIGKKEGTHFFLTSLYARDDENSITVSPDNLTLTPKANYVFGAETKVALFNDHIVIEGEGNGAALTRDTRDASLEIKEIPQFVKGLIDPKVSTSFDYSYTGKMTYNNTASYTRVIVDMKMVGPGYTSLGAPNLRTDQLVYEARADQGLLGRKISISTFFTTSHDNLIEWKSSTTTINAYGVNLGFNFPKLPFFQVSYSPYMQKNNDPVQEQKVDNKTTMFSAVTGYPLMIKEFMFLTNVAYTSNEAQTLNFLSDYHTNALSVTEAISFNNPISFTGSWGMIKAASSSLYSNIKNYDISVNAAYNESLSNTLGFNIASQKDANNKSGIYFNTTVSLWKNINLNGRIEKSNYKDYIDNSLNYNELIFNIMLTANW